MKRWRCAIFFKLIELDLPNNWLYTHCGSAQLLPTQSKGAHNAKSRVAQVFFVLQFGFVVLDPAAETVNSVGKSTALTVGARFKFIFEFTLIKICFLFFFYYLFLINWGNQSSRECTYI